MMINVTDAAELGMTIACREVVGLVTDYLEGQLDAATRVEFEAHLKLCAGCALYLDQMRTTLFTIGQIPVETLSNQAKQSLVTAFRGIRKST
jgi:hypothetical protein